MTNPGRDLANLRPMTSKPCSVCGVMFTGIKRKVTCNKCLDLARVKRYQAKQKGIENV